MSIFVIGDENTVLGFSLVGVQGEAVETRQAARESLDRALADTGIEILLVVDTWADQMRDRVNEVVMATVSPLLVEIPGPEAGRAGPPIEELVREAVGIRLSMGTGGG